MLITIKFGNHVKKTHEKKVQVNIHEKCINFPKNVHDALTYRNEPFLTSTLPKKVNKKSIGLFCIYPKMLEIDFETKLYSLN